VHQNLLTTKRHPQINRWKVLHVVRRKINHTDVVNGKCQSEKKKATEIQLH
jgi:hypothetical protein